MTIMVGTGDERDLRKKTMNSESVPRTSDDFTFVHLGMGWGKVDILTYRNLIYLLPNSWLAVWSTRKFMWYKQKLVITCVRQLSHSGVRIQKHPAFSHESTWADNGDSVSKSSPHFCSLLTNR